MIDSPSSADVAKPERFERIGIAADAENASRIREEFACWLEQFLDLDPIRSSDVVLAINEALANAAEFAYLSAGGVGTMDMQARHDSADAILTVTISDCGVWRMTDPNSGDRTRGRGIPLMRALSDRASIETSSGGTQVLLGWNAVHRTHGRRFGSAE